MNDAKQNIINRFNEEWTDLSNEYATINLLLMLNEIYNQKHDRDDERHMLLNRKVELESRISILSDAYNVFIKNLIKT